jgi:hypothetical protein
MTEGLINGTLDCDLLSYLYIDISNQVGLKDVSLVTAPQHAYVTWAPDGKMVVEWEATTRGGELVDRTKSLYQPVLVKGYDYTPISNEDIRTLQNFQVLVNSVETDNLSLIEKKKLAEKIKALYTQHDHPVIGYYTGDLLNEPELVQNYLKYSASHYPYIWLGKYYADENNFELSKNHYKQGFYLGSVDEDAIDSYAKMLNPIQGTIFSAILRLELYEMEKLGFSYKRELNTFNFNFALKWMMTAIILTFIFYCYVLARKDRPLFILRPWLRRFLNT